MPQYVFRDIVPLRGDPKGKLDAQKVGEIIEGLTGDDKPTRLWKAARASDHYLHNCYEWDKTKAAEAHWRTTSLVIIRSVMVADDDDASDKQRAFYSINGDRGRDYFRADQVIDSLALQVSLLRSAQRDLEAFQRRYRMIADVCELVAKARDKIASKIEAASGEDRAAGAA